MSSGRRRLRRTSRRRHQQRPAAESVRADGRQQQQVVDLTCDNYDEEFVDLTDFDNTPIIIPGTATVRPVTRNEDSLHSPYLISDGSISDDDLPPVPFKITAKPRTKRSTNSGQTSTSTASEALCPVCLDSFRDVKASGRQVMATTCGHVFCEECLQGVLNESAAGRKCPTCRKKLSARTIHPLFI